MNSPAAPLGNDRAYPAPEVAIRPAAALSDSAGLVIGKEGIRLEKPYGTRGFLEDLAEDFAARGDRLSACCPWMPGSVTGHDG
jgi:hypothetical protein